MRQAESNGNGVAGRSVTVEEFMEAGRERLELELVAGKAGTQRQILEPAVNRPGLALTGFFHYFAFRRIQVLGHAEHAFLFSLDEIQRPNRLRAMFERHIPCVVVTRNRRVLPEITKLGEEHKVPVIRCPLVTGRFINMATVLMEDLAAPRVSQQGTMVEIFGIGVMLTGAAGAGKSETALALIKRGHCLVSDDVTNMRMENTGLIIGCAPDAIKYHMEVRGLGIIHVPSLFGVTSVRGQKKLDLVVHLDRTTGVKIDPGSSEQGVVSILGKDVPRVVIPVAPGRDIAALVEVAALNHKLRVLGHDAAKEFDERLIASISKESDRE